MNALLGYVFCVLILICNNNLPVFTAREERFLHFPPKTNIVMTMSLLKLIPNDTIINTLTEFDVLFPIPSHPFEVQPRKKREADKNLFFSQLKDAADTFGLSGGSCLTQLICELQDSLPPSTADEDNLLYDVFNVIFEPGKRITAEECEGRQITCQIPNWINF